MTNIVLREDSRPNFCDKDGKAFLVRCPQCSKENYSANVAIGICTWCRWDLNEHKIVNLKNKKIDLNNEN